MRRVFVYHHRLKKQAAQVIFMLIIILAVCTAETWVEWLPLP